MYFNMPHRYIISMEECDTVFDKILQVLNSKLLTQSIILCPFFKQQEVHTWKMG